MSLQRDNGDSRPNPDPTLLTTAALDREIAHPKELMVRDQEAQQEALEVALTQMDRRLGELNELRKAVEKDRVEFVRVDVYAPAHEELRRQRVADGERIIAILGDIKQNASAVDVKRAAAPKENEQFRESLSTSPWYRKKFPSG